VSLWLELFYDISFFSHVYVNRRRKRKRATHSLRGCASDKIFMRPSLICPAIPAISYFLPLNLYMRRAPAAPPAKALSLKPDARERERREIDEDPACSDSLD
jgi:hypothetical protein